MLSDAEQFEHRAVGPFDVYVYKVDGQVMCTGTNTWTARAWITPAGNARFTSNQSTVWDTGDCADTEWVEHYRITDGHLVRSWGGNGSTFVWDVTYEPVG